MSAIAVLGSTGSVGSAALDVVRTHANRFRVCALAAHRNWKVLAAQAREFRPDSCVLVDRSHEAELRQALAGLPIEIHTGPEALAAAARHPDAETVVGAVSGAAGLPASVAALEEGKRLALANKESLVMAGPLLLRIAGSTGAEILPVDSEHSALFQALRCGRPQEVHRLILTASGGPFRRTPLEDLADRTPEDALRHPTWDMGAKITIDSATMMNKALEVVEARWLFDVEPARIRVVVHPQSIIHSMVEYHDGSIVAQMSEPDMRVPIQYALTYPERLPRETPRFELEAFAQLTFEEPDVERFPALRLGFEAAERGGTLGVVLNAANEVAVRHFLDRNIAFPTISEVAVVLCGEHDVREADSIATVLEVDRWARREAERVCASLGLVH